MNQQIKNIINELEEFIEMLEFDSTQVRQEETKKYILGLKKDMNDILNRIKEEFPDGQEAE